jgi:hypothetical protein
VPGPGDGQWALSDARRLEHGSAHSPRLENLLTTCLVKVFNIAQTVNQCMHRVP